MDDDGVAEEQARLLREVVRRSRIEVKQLWFRYFSLGGGAGEVEVDAYLHHCMGLPPFQRDLLAHAANELIARQPLLRAPYASELTGHPHSEE